MKQPIFSIPRVWLTSVVVLLAVAGCQKDFLDRKPQGDLTYDTFFENADQAVLATNAVYQVYREFNTIALPYIGLTDIISDDADKGSTPTDGYYLVEVDDLSFNATNIAMSAVWKSRFVDIARANLAIQRIPDVPMEETLKNRLVGECKFLRAFSYFQLVQWFGDLPIITRPLDGDEYYAQDRRPKTEVYAQIEQDLLDAIATLPEKSQYSSKDLGRATKGAAKGILAKLYMVEKNFPKAEQYCLEIINSGEYDLLPKYSDNFLRVGENGKESMFEINAAALPTQNAAGPGATPYNMVQGVRGIPNLGWGFNRPSDNLIQAFENGDPRREA
ncbi:MAG: RagB/SusD family nutrient uptake outer membrane protein, partial [Saprospiraceae bacterium]